MRDLLLLLLLIFAVSSSVILFGLHLFPGMIGLIALLIVILGVSLAVTKNGRWLKTPQSHRRLRIIGAGLLVAVVPLLAIQSGPTLYFMTILLALSGIVLMLFSYTSGKKK